MGLVGGWGEVFLFFFFCFLFWGRKGGVLAEKGQT